MWEFLAAAPNLPFSIAIGLMVLIGVIELVSMVLGGSLSSAVDGLLPDIDLDIDVPDIDVPDVDIPDMDAPSVDAPGSFATLLSWLNVGRVPFLVLFVIFLSAFGMVGIGLQGFTYEGLGFLWPAWLAAIPAFVVSLPITRFMGLIVGKIMPKDETLAVSQDSLIGRIAIIVLGTATLGSAAQGKVKDEHGRDHYVMIEPDTDSETFNEGQSVLLVRRGGGTYFAIGDVSRSLTH